jgi:hypothetical protein
MNNNSLWRETGLLTDLTNNFSTTLPMYIFRRTQES